MLLIQIFSLQAIPIIPTDQTIGFHCLVTQCISKILDKELQYSAFFRYKVYSITEKNLFQACSKVSGFFALQF